MQIFSYENKNKEANRSIVVNFNNADFYSM